MRSCVSSEHHISKQRLFGLPSELMSKGKHFILIRNPLNILQPSFEKVHPPSFLELGLGELVSIYSDLCQMGTPPAVIDADELQRDPEMGGWSYTRRWSMGTMVVQECARVNRFLISKEVSTYIPFVTLRFAGAKSTALQHS